MSQFPSHFNHFQLSLTRSSLISNTYITIITAILFIIDIFILLPISSRNHRMPYTLITTSFQALNNYLSMLDLLCSTKGTISKQKLSISRIKLFHTLQNSVLKIFSSRSRYTNLISSSWVFFIDYSLSALSFSSLPIVEEEDESIK
jgi:hypothetical protein